MTVKPIYYIGKDKRLYRDIGQPEAYSKEPWRVPVIEVFSYPGQWHSTFGETLATKGRIISEQAARIIMLTRPEGTDTNYPYSTGVDISGQPTTGKNAIKFK